MEREPLDFAARTSLTRVSVTGGNGWFTVRHGGEDPVRVCVTDSGLHCECGRSRCAHVASLVMCGFVEHTLPESRAA